MNSQFLTPSGRLSHHAQARVGRVTVPLDHHAAAPAWKRTLDILCILLTLPLWLPLMVLITFWIKVVSPGPVFFQQERVGHWGRHFMILKFRSMKVDAETCLHEHHAERLIQTNCPMTKLDAVDPRIILGGRILRAVGLDELPQLINVLRGDMSLVGPRPCLPREFARYDSHQRRRVIVLPGLTGYWQVNGKNKTTFNQMIDLDLSYAQRMCLLLDLWIMLRTFPALVTQLIEVKLKGTGGSPSPAGSKSPYLPGRD